uniref:Uncharacterized protein n=1 Tax=Schizaphis graminum TaxID=13262 RepID=A0A2S2PAS6_SCHGA
MSKMGIAWFCVLLISFNVCKADDVQTIRTPNNLSMANSEEYMDILKNSPECTQTFLTWIKENIQDGIQCTNVGNDPMKCETTSGSNIETNLEVWDQLPSYIRDQWTISTFYIKAIGSLYSILLLS